VDLAVPRDRNGTFEPQIVRKGQTRLEGFNECPMSSRRCVAAAVEGGIEGGAVLPAAPDDPQPGSGQDPGGVRMPAATPVAAA
jgi:hypothetical protein